MKIILEFDTDADPGARKQAQDAMNVGDMRSALQEYHRFLRRHYKHGSSDDPKTEIAREFNAEFFDCLQRHGIEDVY